jgi:hypothetical protein
LISTAARSTSRRSSHDLRKTAATRVEAVSSHAVAKMFLGHSDENVTHSYLQPSLDDVRDAVNRAARSIDGQIPPGTIAFPTRAVAPAVTVGPESFQIDERSVSNPHGWPVDSSETCE